MKIWACLMFVLASSPNLTAQTMVSADNSAFVYIGRTDFSSPSSPIIYNAGSCIRIRFQGTAVSAVFSDLNSKGDQPVGVMIDGSEMVIYKIPRDTRNYTLPIGGGLADTEHDLLIAKTLGFGSGYYALQFHGLILDNGKGVSSPPVPARGMETYGNSLTEGGGGDCMPPDNGDCGANNGWNSWANILARKLDFSIHNNGISGLAVLNNTGWYQSQTTGLETTYNKLCATNEGGHTYTNWDFGSWKADLVVFGMGINDEYANGLVDVAKWKDTFKKIIREIMNSHGKGKPVILAPGNMWNFNACRYSEEIVNELKSEGYNSWYYKYSFELSHHPNREEHTKMAAELYDYIAANGIIDALSPYDSMDTSGTISASSLEITAYPRSVTIGQCCTVSVRYAAAIDGAISVHFLDSDWNWFSAGGPVTVGANSSGDLQIAVTIEDGSGKGLLKPGSNYIFKAVLSDIDDRPVKDDVFSGGGEADIIVTGGSSTPNRPPGARSERASSKFDFALFEQKTVSGGIAVMYSLAVRSNVFIDIFDTRGNKVGAHVRAVKPAGIHRLELTAVSPCTPYICRMRAVPATTGAILARQRIVYPVR
jgi:uncharacterized protein YaiE (UPF0345 family)